MVNKYFVRKDDNLLDMYCGLMFVISLDFKWLKFGMNPKQKMLRGLRRSVTFNLGQNFSTRKGKKCFTW